METKDVQIQEYDRVECELSWVPSMEMGCLTEVPHLPLEWGRYVLMDRWLQQSKTKESDWALMIPDAQNVLIQSGNVFEHLDDLHKQHDQQTGSIIHDDGQSANRWLDALRNSCN